MYQFLKHLGQRWHGHTPACALQPGFLGNKAMRHSLWCPVLFPLTEKSNTWRLFLASHLQKGIFLDRCVGFCRPNVPPVCQFMFSSGSG